MALTDRTAYHLSDLIAVNVLLSYDEELQVWVAHCLELDVVEDGSSRGKAIKHLLNTMAAQVNACLEDGLDFIELASPELWKEWRFGKPFVIGDDTDCATPHFQMVVKETL